MEIGIHLVGSYAGRSAGEWDELRRTAKLVEDVGASHLFLGENHLTISELTLRILEAGRATSSVLVGPGATNIIFRHETSLLSTMSTVSDLVDGDRVFMGMSAGDTALRMMGIPATPPAELRGSISRMRELMQGGAVDYNDRAVSMQGLQQMPFYLFAEGPKMTAVGVEVADVLVYGGGVSPEAVAWAKDAIASSESARLDGLPPLKDWYCVMVSVGETEDDARQKIASRMANRVKHNLTANPGLVPEANREEAERLVREFNPRYWEASNGRLVTPYMFKRFGIVGTLDTVRERLHNLANLGVERVMLDFPVTEVESSLELLGSTVFPELVS